MHRQRWIGVAFDMFSQDSYDMACLQAQWVGDMYPTPSNYGCLFQLSQQEKIAMTLSPVILQRSWICTGIYESRTIITSIDGTFQRNANIDGSIWQTA